MTSYLTVRDLTEQLSRLDPDIKIELEVRHEVRHDDLDSQPSLAEVWTDTEPLIDLHVHCCGSRYVTLRGDTSA